MDQPTPETPFESERQGAQNSIVEKSGVCEDPDNSSRKFHGLLQHAHRMPCSSAVDDITESKEDVYKDNKCWDQKTRPKSLNYELQTRGNNASEV